MDYHLDETPRAVTMRLAWALLLAMQFVPRAGAASAEEVTPVRLAIQTPAGRARSQAPQTLELTLTNQSATLLEGELELSIFVGRQRVLNYRSDPLALGDDPYRFRILIPAIAVHNEQLPVTSVGKFIGNRRIYNLDDVDIVVPPHWKRWFVLAISRPETEVAHRDRFSIEAALSPERFNVIQGDATLTDLLTTPAVMPPAALPATSTGYLSFDVVLLEGGGFSELRDGQLSALAAWVEAGGSVVVRPTDQLKPAHVAFLNRLATSDNGEALYLLDERGRIDRASSALGAPVARCFSGLGRTVVLHQPRDRDEDFRSDEWIETAMFVWKIKADQQQAIRTNGKWNFQLPPNPYTVVGLDGPKPFAPQEQPLEAPLRALLIPAKVQGLPFWVVVSILAAFLLLIAPGDYLLLGALRARRLTWILLTVTSLAFTIGTVRITERVMGTTDYRRALVFNDLGPEGQPKRTSRYELLFTATQKAITPRFQNALYAGIDDRITRPTIHMPGSYYGKHGLTDDEIHPRMGLAPDLPEYVGKLPADYEIRQQMRQWSPLVSRQTAIGGSDEIPDWNWKELGNLAWEISEGRRALQERIRKTEPEARVLLFHQMRMHDLSHDQQVDMPSSSSAEPMRGVLVPVKAGTTGPNVQVTSAGTFQYVTLGANANSGQSADPLMSLIRQASVAAPQGLFAIVSQISPTGADGLEDLALLDPTDSAQWLLVIVVPRGDDQVVFRKLYRRAG